MSEDTKENNVVDFVAYRQERERLRVEQEESEQSSSDNSEQEGYFMEDYYSMTNPHGAVVVDGQIYSVEDLLTPEQSADMVNTIMHMLKLLDERDGILSDDVEPTDTDTDTDTETNNNSDNNIEEDE